MKIAHIVDTMSVGGAETVVAQMCRLQRQQGHEPQVYAISQLGELGKNLQSEGFRVESDVGRHLVDSSLGFFRLLRAFKPDVAHLHDPTATIYAALAARLSGVPSVISTRHSLVAPPWNIVAERKYVIAARFCDWIVGICEATANNIKNVGHIPVGKIACVYNGALGIELLAKEHWPIKDGFTLLFVGRLEQVKNLPLMLEAVSGAVAKNERIRLWIVGDGSQRSMLEQLTCELGLKSTVTFWGQQLEVAKFFSAADVFVMSSESEGLPISLLQAFSVGLPAIVTDVGGMAEVVRFADGGTVVPLTDNKAMTEEILHFADNAVQRNHFSANAKAAFSSRFTLDAMVSSYEKIYRNTRRAKRIGCR